MLTADRVEMIAWLDAHAAPRRGESDWSNGPVAHTPEAEREFFERCRSWQRLLYDSGWMTFRAPTPAARAAFAAEMAAYDCTSGFIGATINMVSAVLSKHATAAQRARFTTPLLRGDETWCQLFSEPAAGSDLANLSARAVRDGDSFVVTGQKVWNSNAHLCEWAMLIARTDPDAPKHRGITFFLVDMASPGIDVRPLRQISGHCHFNEVFLDEVRIPAGLVLGEVGGGWAPTRTVLGAEAGQIGTTANSGDATALIALARAAGRSGEATLRQRLARVFSDERILAWSSGRKDVDASVLKVLWSEMRVRKDNTAVDVLGPGGALFGADASKAGFWQTELLNWWWGTVGGGTSEIHRNMIGERALGLPAEPRVDRTATYRELTEQGLA